MSYDLLLLNDHPVAVPSHWSGDEQAETALESLLQAAAPYYNRALRAHTENDVVEALRCIESALRLFPYSLPVVEASIAMAIRHGLFIEASARLQWATQADMTADWPDYEAALDEAVTRWNLFVDDTDALRGHYQQPQADACYRELLLLAKRLGTGRGRAVTDAERSHLASFDITVFATPFDTVPRSADLSKEADQEGDSQSAKASVSKASPRATKHESDRKSEPTGGRRQTMVTAGIAAVIGILLGVGGMWASLVGTGPLSESALSAPVASPSPQTTTQTEQDHSAATAPITLQTAAALSQAQLHLLQNNPLAAHAMLDTLNVESSDMAQQVRTELKAATNQALYDRGTAAWMQGDSSTALQMLRRVVTTDVGAPQDRLYALGMAAAREGEPSVAVDALTRLQEHLTPAWPHYDAQAAYTLVRLLPDDEARSYAERIANRYPDTIYNNSVVQAYL